MTRKVPLIIHRGSRTQKIGEAVIDDYDQVTFVITDPVIVTNLTESKSESFTALIFDGIID